MLTYESWSCFQAKWLQKLFQDFYASANCEILFGQVIVREFCVLSVKNKIEPKRQENVQF